jgi:hypothetical protein
MQKLAVCVATFVTLFGQAAYSHEAKPADGALELNRQNAALSAATEGKGFGPQSPRDLAQPKGQNQRLFSVAPTFQKMNLCNIHFHKNAEHKGGEFTKAAGSAEGHGYQAGYVYNRKLKAADSQPLNEDVCKSDHGGLNVGDTIEVHYVHSTAQVQPGETLGACLSETDKNPQLRVEAQVMVLVNDAKSADFNKLMELGMVNGMNRAVNIPTNTGKPIQYAGSTTGPSYNEKGSPLEASWSVRPKVLKVNAASVGKWCEGNVFKEDHAHGVRNLVTDPKLLSAIH